MRSGSTSRRIVFERVDQFVREFAADAAAGQFDGARVARAEQRAIDAERAEIVHDDGEALAARLRVGEQRAHERRLARAEEAGDDERGNAAGFRGFHACTNESAAA